MTASLDKNEAEERARTPALPVHGKMPMFVGGRQRFQFAHWPKSRRLFTSWPMLRRIRATAVACFPATGGVLKPQGQRSFFVSRVVFRPFVHHCRSSSSTRQTLKHVFRGSFIVGHLSSLGVGTVTFERDKRHQWYYSESQDLRPE